MNRRSFLKWFGFGAAAVAVPAIAAVKAPAEELTYCSQPLVIDQMRNPLLRGELGRYEGVVFHTKTVSLEEARGLFPADQWSGQEILRLRRMASESFVINKIATVEDRHLAGLITRS